MCARRIACGFVCCGQLHRCFLEQKLQPDCMQEEPTKRPTAQAVLLSLYTQMGKPKRASSAPAVAPAREIIEVFSTRPGYGADGSPPPSSGEALTDSESSSSESDDDLESSSTSSSHRDRYNGGGGHNVVRTGNHHMRNVLQRLFSLSYWSSLQG